MGKQKKQTTGTIHEEKTELTRATPPAIQAQVITPAEIEGFEKLDELFRVNEDNYNAHQDNKLLSLIENENAINDKVKIKYLFKKYRNEARDNHGV